MARPESLIVNKVGGSLGDFVQTLWLLHEEETSGGKMGNGASAWEAALGICTSGWMSRGSCKVCG